MEAIFIIVIFFTVLAVLITGSACAASPKWKAIAGVAALAWSGLMFTAARMAESFNLNIWYGQSAHNLIDAAVQSIDSGREDQVSRHLAEMRDALEVTYEHRGNFKELADKTTVKLKEPGSRQDSRAEYRRFVPGGGKEQQVFTQLEKIQIDDISFEQLSIPEALDYLSHKITGDSGGGVINFVIQGGGESKKIGIKSKRSSFPQAVDEICVQSGRRWRIDFNMKSGAPILVIAVGDDPSILHD